MQIHFYLFSKIILWSPGFSDFDQWKYNGMIDRFLCFLGMISFVSSLLPQKKEKDFHLYLALRAVIAWSVDAATIFIYTHSLTAAAVWFCIHILSAYAAARLVQGVWKIIPRPACCRRCVCSLYNFFRTIDKTLSYILTKCKYLNAAALLIVMV